MGELDKPKVSIATIVISAVLAAVVFGGGVYAYQSNKAKKDQDALKSQITALETEKANLEKQVADKTNTTTPTSSTVTSSNSASNKQYSSSTFGFSFSYSSTTTVKEVSTSLSDDKGGKVVVTANDFSADIHIAKSNAAGASNGSYVIGMQRNNQLSDTSLVSKTTSLAAGNFSFLLLDVNADPSYVSAFANLDNTLVDVAFTSLNGKSKMTAYRQSDLPQSAKDFLTSFNSL